MECSGASADASISFHHDACSMPQQEKQANRQPTECLKTIWDLTCCLRRLHAANFNPTPCIRA